MVEIDLPFTAENEVLVLSGHKTAATRRGTKGRPGDVFRVRGVLYRIKAVPRMTLRDVAYYWYREEGFKEPRWFSHIWAQLHPRTGWRPDQRVTLHIFERVPEEWDQPYPPEVPLG